MTLASFLGPTLPVLSLALSLTAARWLAAHPNARLSRLDHPNERSLHTTPVPRTGGLALLLGLIIPLGLAWLLVGVPSPLGWIAAALSLVALVSYLDDLGHLPPLLRLGVHILAAALLLLGGLGWPQTDLPGLVVAMPSLVWIGLSLLFIVWMINLYNFMDGMDGLAGGMALIGFSTLAVLGLRGGEPVYGVAALCIALAAAGFLRVNFPPARIFLGDIGSSSLGLLAAGFSLWGARLGLFPLWTAWLIFSPFIADATWTLLARIRRGERVWEAHRSHHYQRLALAGWSHRKTVLRAYLLMAAAAGCALATPEMAVRDQWTLLAGWGAVYLLLHLKVGLVERGSASR